MLSQEITIVYTGRWHAHELRHPAESVHHRMHLDAPVSPGSVQRFSPHYPQYLAERSDGGAVNELQGIRSSIWERCGCPEKFLLSSIGFRFFVECKLSCYRRFSGTALLMSFPFLTIVEKKYNIIYQINTHNEY